MIDSKFLIQTKYKNETIKEQFFDGKDLHIITFEDSVWTLYNHTKNTKICNSKNWYTIFEKLYKKGNK